MTDESKQQGRSTRARAAEREESSEQTRKGAPAAAEAPAAPEAVAAEGGPSVPTPPAPTGEPESASGDATEYDKDVLVANAPQLLGVESAVARGVLREADDNLTIDAAKTRIREFLEGDVTVADTEEA